MLLGLLIHSRDVEQKDGEVVGEERGMEKGLEQRKLCSEILPCQHRNELESWLSELIATRNF